MIPGAPRRRTRRESLHPLQPDLSPIRIDATRAESMVIAGADHIFQDDAGVLKPDHPAASLVDYPLDAAQHPGLPPAVLQHLGVERHPAVLVVHVEGLDDRFLALDPDQLARLKAEDYLPASSSASLR